MRNQGDRNKRSSPPRPRRGGERESGGALRIARLAGSEGTPDLSACVDALDPDAPPDYRALAAVLAHSFASSRRRRVGLAGGQGTGKSTLAHLLEQAGAHFGMRVCTLALDDYYLPRAERLALAARVHPLFETRGPPGTHDVALLRDHLIALGETGAIDVPRFDKGLDDRSGSCRIEGPFDLVVVEGWCVGARSVDESALASPCNSLERDEDADGRWRRHANERLAAGYAELFSLLETTVYLRAPDLAAIRHWRLAQESERPERRRMDAAAVDRFVAHYERITCDMQARLPGKVDWTIELDPDHGIAGIVRRGPDRATDRS